MFKKIKNYFSLQRRIQFEVLETLATICLYCGFDSPRNPYREHLQGHFNSLKNLSDEMRNEEWDRLMKDIKSKTKTKDVECKTNKYIY